MVNQAKYVTEYTKKHEVYLKKHGDEIFSDIYCIAYSFNGHRNEDYDGFYKLSELQKITLHELNELKNADYTGE